jgi:uncharacterized protein (TIGR01777 family)
MTYLLTGATGFIGRALVAKLLADGHNVCYLARQRSTTLDSRAAFFLWQNIERTLPPLETVPRIDALIHLAGESVAQRWTAEVKQRIRSTRVEGTRNLVTAIAKLRHKPPLLISASAVGFYGNRGDEVLTEASTPGTSFLADVCVEWEREAERAREFGLRVVHIRIGTVLGPDGGALGKMLPPFRMGAGGKIGDGRQWISWIHRDDLVRLFEFATTNETAPPVMNGTAPEPVSNATFTTALAHAVHRPALLPIPRFGLRLAFGEMSDVLFDSARVLPAAAQSAGFSFTYSRLAAALQSILQKAA